MINKTTQYIIYTSPSLFFDSIVEEVQNLKTSRINLAQMKAKIIDHDKN